MEEWSLICLSMGRVSVSSWRWFKFVSAVQPVASLRAAFWVVWSFCIEVGLAIGPYIVEQYSSIGLVIALYVVVMVSFCFPQVVEVRAFSIDMVFLAF